MRARCMIQRNFVIGDNHVKHTCTCPHPYASCIINTPQCNSIDWVMFKCACIDNTLARTQTCKQGVIARATQLPVNTHLSKRIHVQVCWCIAMKIHCITMQRTRRNHYTYTHPKKCNHVTLHTRATNKECGPPCLMRSLWRRREGGFWWDPMEGGFWWDPMATVQG